MDALDEWPSRMGSSRTDRTRLTGRLVILVFAQLYTAVSRQCGFRPMGGICLSAERVFSTHCPNALCQFACRDHSSTVRRTLDIGRPPAEALRPETFFFAMASYSGSVSTGVFDLR